MLSVDPVTAYDSGDWRHLNRYAYAYNNPYKFTDPDGRLPECAPNCTTAQADAYVAGQAKNVVGTIAATAVVGAGAAVAVSTGAVGATVVAGQRALAATEATMANAGVAVQAGINSVTATVTQVAHAVNTAVQTNPVVIAAATHADKVADAIEGGAPLPGDSPPPMSTVGLAADAVKRVVETITEPAKPRPEPSR